MILHSIIPVDVIFNKDETELNKSFLEIDYLGEKVQVTPLSNEAYVINRLISTSPQAYLNPSLQPGSIIHLNPNNTQKNN